MDPLILSEYKAFARILQFLTPDGVLDTSPIVETTDRLNFSVNNLEISDTYEDPFVFALCVRETLRRMDDVDRFFFEAEAKRKNKPSLVVFASTDESVTGRSTSVYRKGSAIFVTWIEAVVCPQRLYIFMYSIWNRMKMHTHTPLDSENEDVTLEDIGNTTAKLVECELGKVRDWKIV
jgi:hypothetical protein